MTTNKKSIPLETVMFILGFTMGLCVGIAIGLVWMGLAVV